MRLLTAVLIALPLLLLCGVAWAIEAVHTVGKRIAL